MLKIKTITNNLQDVENKNKFCFRSNPEQFVTEEEIIQDMTQYNSTLTDTDAAAALMTLTSVIKRNLEQGNGVDLPFCRITIAAQGTCSDINQSFRPGTGDNTFKLRMTAPKSFMDDMLKNITYKQVQPDLLTNPSIISLYSIGTTGNLLPELVFTAGSILRISGSFLTVDVTDAQQGVTLLQGTTPVKITRYHRIGTNVLECYIPEEASPGIYQVSVTTKPGANRYKTEIADTTIEVTA